ncbi:IS1634 family transposase [Heliobacterium chlorum]|uniref:IS1634 family transposase n=1 Tax=Heliobacterium chlorum TaxID=2698 RepID=A0ABR7TA65_HELCL|nr:IS1634 family transposase [Heliobacterium chlorum]MBC9786726.1 IS1634 family transposase [Heliobacterium chlorum]
MKEVKYPENIDILSVGAMPIIADYCNELGMREIVNDVVRWDKDQWSITPGELLIAMVINLLISRSPLYRIRQFYENTDLDLIFGKGRVTLPVLHDRHFGELLDRMHEANPRLIFDMISTNAILRHDIDLTLLRSDTTSHSVYGAYDGAEHSALNITYGHSKDHRPDLKQFLYGLVVAEGVPVAGTVMDGNTSDKAWNPEMIRELSEMVVHHVQHKVMYIADSAAVTPDSLHALHDQMYFVSRLPGTYGLTTKVKARAFAENQWVQVGPLNERNHAAEYKLWVTEDELEGHHYRFIVVQSTALAKSKLQTIQRKVEQEQKKLQKMISDQEKRRYACEADAQVALMEFLSACPTAFHNPAAQVQSIQKEIPRQTRGRRPTHYVPEYETLWQIVGQVGPIDPVKLQAAQHFGETFILMTNEFTLDPVEVLRRYKGQISIENRFRWLKNPTGVDQTWLKTPKRVLSLGYVFLIGLLIYSLVERRLRKNLSQETKSLRLPGNRLTKTPTTTAFLQLFQDVSVMTVVNPDGSIHRVLPRRFNTPELQRATRLVGVNFMRFSLTPEEFDEQLHT